MAVARTAARSTSASGQRRVARLTLPAMSEQYRIRLPTAPFFRHPAAAKVHRRVARRERRDRRVHLRPRQPEHQFGRGADRAGALQPQMVGGLFTATRIGRRRLRRQWRRRVRLRRRHHRLRAPCNVRPRRRTAPHQTTERHRHGLQRRLDEPGHRGEISGRQPPLLGSVVARRTTVAPQRCQPEPSPAALAALIDMGVTASPSRSASMPTRRPPRTSWCPAWDRWQCASAAATSQPPPTSGCSQPATPVSPAGGNAAAFPARAIVSRGESGISSPTPVATPPFAPCPGHRPFQARRPAPADHAGGRRWRRHHPDRPERTRNRDTHHGYRF